MEVEGSWPTLCLPKNSRGETMQRFKQGRLLAAFFMVLCLTVGLAISASADSQTQIAFPRNGTGYIGTITTVQWYQTPDVKGAQFTLAAMDGSWSYNSGPIYMAEGRTFYEYHLPADVYNAMPKGKQYRLSVENYHYSGGSYTGYSGDVSYFNLQ